MLTLKDLQDKLAENLDEITIVEILEITSRELVDRFPDKIEERQDELINDWEEEDWNDDGSWNDDNK